MGEVVVMGINSVMRRKRLSVIQRQLEDNADTAVFHRQQIKNKSDRLIRQVNSVREQPKDKRAEGFRQYIKGEIKAIVMHRKNLAMAIKTHKSLAKSVNHNLTANRSSLRHSKLILDNELIITNFNLGGVSSNFKSIIHYINSLQRLDVPFLKKCYLSIRKIASYFKYRYL